MTGSSHSSILRKMAGARSDEPAESPITSSRAVRMALTKAANDTVGLVLTVRSIAEDIMPLDQMLSTFDDGMMLVALKRHGRMVGVAAWDMQMRAAVLEMQTMGKLIAMVADARPATGTDKTMCDPLLAALLAVLPSAVVGTDFEGWIDDVTPDARLESARAAGLMLDDCSYRSVRMTVDLGVADRTGSLVLTLPMLTRPAELPDPEPAPLNWGDAFRANVMDSPAVLDALLHRFKMSLGRAQNLQVGQVVALPGCTVNSVRLISADGQNVAQAKLGQVGGMRAVRIENAVAPQMRDLPGANDLGFPAMTRDDDVGMALSGNDLIEEPAADVFPAADFDFDAMAGDDLPAFAAD